ncbi:MAG TPA: serine/threonine-protein kinase [Candidatus Polarisedimenticolaceae bacterium]|nr:serine/threonine-protein kinase [Candidatus Polarisedimenticolaceae bacterium]
MSTAPTPAATSVAGRYLLRERIGAGAAGEIWSAEDPRIGRRVAVKFLRIPEGLAAEQRSEWEGRFLLEARAAGRLSHPSIVSIHDVGATSDGRPFIVMELVEGRSLDVIRQSGPRPELSQIVAWIGELAEALEAAHACGVIHRDVKPANILVGIDGRARITDFGIARVAESELTRDGTFVGSPAFAAPEQLCGAKVDGRADVFALAAVFYLVTTGRRPFVGDDIPSIVYAVCHLEPEPPRLSPEIDAVVLRALAKSPDDRYPSAHEFGIALRAAANPLDAAAPVDSAEARAGSIGSAAAVGVVRGARAMASTLSRVDAKRWWQIAAAAALLVVVLVTARAARENREERRGNVLERFRAAMTSKTSRVVVAADGLPANAVLDIREGDSVLLHEPAVSGLTFRLAPGDHDLTLALTSPDGLDLRKAIELDVDPRSTYALELSVASWPWERLAADWEKAP